MTLFGYRVPMMASLLVWCVLWEMRRTARPDLPAAALQRGAGRRGRSRADAVLAERDDHHPARLC